MKLLNRLRDLRNENNAESNLEQVYTNHQHQDLLGVGTTTIDDILRLDIADTHHHRLYSQHQD